MVATDDKKKQDSVAEWTDAMNSLASNWQKAMDDWPSMWSENINSSLNATGASLKDSLQKNPTDLLANLPLANVDRANIVSAQTELWQDYQKLWLHTASRLLNPDSVPLEDDSRDPRFKDPLWSENPVFEFIKKSYQLNSKWLCSYLSNIAGLDEATGKKVEFYGQQMVDAMAPTNYPLTNPMVLREIADTKGENIIRGFDKLVEDLKDGFGGFRPRQSHVEDFEIGKDIAATPGDVIFQTPIMQLIQYAPATVDVYKKPLLIVPPWINKFYVLDLHSDNSFIKWAVDQGHTVFVVSWVNPDETYADKSFDDYATEGILAALDAIEQATGERQVNAIGYCIGGTLMAATLAYMAQHNDDRITNITFLATQVDFEDAGDLKLFTDEEQVASIEQQITDKGYLDGEMMATAFNMLRANDLIWYFHVNNYLMGKEPPKFDLLYWNADATRFPARLLIDYLRGFYVENRLSTPGAFKLLGTPIDLGNINIPVYLQATIGDHIAPAESVFKATKLYSGRVRFVLGGSGHIAGVINPPKPGKYQYWLNSKRKKYDSVATWREDAVEHPGSWWPDWNKWLSTKSGGKVPARKIGGGKLQSLEPAPGSYVKVRS